MKTDRRSYKLKLTFYLSDWFKVLGRNVKGNSSSNLSLFFFGPS